MNNNDSLKFTVITPSFNQGEFLEETIKSVITQSYTNFEYFVIDGGSTDGSVDVIRKYDDKIDYWLSEKDRGQSHALNKGLEKAAGDILIWINSDDVLEPDALLRAEKYFREHPSISVVHGKTIVFNKHFQEVRGADIRCLPEIYLSGMAFPQPSAFIRRSALMQVYPRFEERLHFGMDYELFACLFLNFDFLNVNDIFSRYRLHAHSKTIEASNAFAKDWMVVYNNILNTLPESEVIRAHLGTLDMTVADVRSYPVLKSFDENFLIKSFQYFLKYQVMFYYQGLNLKKVVKICSFLKKTFPSFYNQEHLYRMHRLAQVPAAKYLIPIMRKKKF